MTDDKYRYEAQPTITDKSVTVTLGPEHHAGRDMAPFSKWDIIKHGEGVIAVIGRRYSIVTGIKRGKITWNFTIQAINASRIPLLRKIQFAIIRYTFKNK